MTSNSEKLGNRRQFLKGWIRTILFGGILYIGGLLGLRTKRTSEYETECAFELPCKSCEKRSFCTDSKALN